MPLTLKADQAADDSLYSDNEYSQEESIEETIANLLDVANQYKFFIEDDFSSLASGTMKNSDYAQLILKLKNIRSDYVETFQKLHSFIVDGSAPSIDFLLLTASHALLLSKAHRTLGETFDAEEQENYSALSERFNQIANNLMEYIRIEQEHELDEEIAADAEYVPESPQYISDSDSGYESGTSTHAEESISYLRIIGAMQASHQDQLDELDAMYQIELNRQEISHRQELLAAQQQAKFWQEQAKSLRQIAMIQKQNRNAEIQTEKPQLSATTTSLFSIDSAVKADRETQTDAIHLVEQEAQTNPLTPKAAASSQSTQTTTLTIVTTEPMLVVNGADSSLSSPTRLAPYSALLSPARRTPPQSPIPQVPESDSENEFVHVSTP